MTGSQLLVALAGAIQARLPGWTVNSTPQPDLADRTVEIGLGQAVVTHYQFAAPAVEEQVLIRLSLRNTTGAYATLADARDAVALALFDVYPTLLNQEAELIPQNTAGTWEAMTPDASSTQGVYWTATLRVPVRRRIA